MISKAKLGNFSLAMHGRPSGWNTTIKTDGGLRQALLKFIGDFANWNNAAKTEYLVTSRGLVQAAHPEQTPLVVDPFAGGGSIPLEALRLGCDAFASDLNPVACLILKVMLEDIPRHGQSLADDCGRRARISKHRPRRKWPTFTQGPRRCHNHRLPVGPHGALRGSQLRGRNSPDALHVAVPEAQAQMGAAPQRGAG